MARKSVKGTVRVVWARNKKTQIKIKKKSDGRDSQYFDIPQTYPNYDAVVAAALTAYTTKGAVQLFYNDANDTVLDLAIF